MSTWVNSLLVILKIVVSSGTFHHNRLISNNITLFYLQFFSWCSRRSTVCISVRKYHVGYRFYFESHVFTCVHLYEKMRSKYLIINVLWLLDYLPSSTDSTWQMFSKANFVRWNQAILFLTLSYNFWNLVKSAVFAWSVNRSSCCSRDHYDDDLVLNPFSFHFLSESEIYRSFTSFKNLVTCNANIIICHIFVNSNWKVNV